MIALSILDLKDFTRDLFIGDTFDPFLVSEGSVTTYYTFSIDGALHRDFYTEEEQDALHLRDRDYIIWSECKPFCFSLIKGKHTPLYFKFVFQLSRDNIEKFLVSSGVPLSSEDVFGLFLNVTYDGTTLSCTTGTSMRTFTLDKTLDNSWDIWIMSFFKQHGIPTEQL